MDIKQLKYFIAIAEEEQITKAAKKLHIAQPHLSRQLKLLEDELGVNLVERGSKKISLTDAGKLLKSKADQIISLTNSTITEIQDFNQGSFGNLKIGTISSLGTSFLNQKLMDFHKEYPLVNFEIFEGNTFNLLELLKSGIIEIGFVRTPFDLNDYDYISLPSQPMIAVMTDDLYWESDDVISLEELRTKPLIIYRRFEKLISELCQQENFQPRFICKNDDARTTLLWAASGLGIGLVPKSAIEFVRGEKLRYKELSHPLLETQILAIWMKNKDLSPVASNFLKFFQTL